MCHFGVNGVDMQTELTEANHCAAAALVILKTNYQGILKSTIRVTNAQKEKKIEMKIVSNIEKKY